MKEMFLNIEYLKVGNERQQLAYRTLKELGIFESLSPFDPLLAGTIPLGIDIETSDLDIVCCFNDPDLFESEVRLRYENMPSFTLQKDATEVLILCNFWTASFPVEIYATTTPSESSNAFKHMIAEWRIINLVGHDFCNRIIELKKSGMKTEPAFASLLKLEGDPYKRVLEICDYSDDKLKNLLETVL